jgi:hypothetical protein
MEIYVTAGTSAVLVDTSLLIPPITTAIVYLTSLPSGQTVTIRDSAGDLSPPKSIVVSTIGASPLNPSQPQITFADGTSSIVITNPYGYITATSRNETTWILANSFGFPENKVIASVNALTTTSLETSYITTSSLVTSSIATNDMTVNESITCTGPVRYSTLVVGPPYTRVDGTATTIYGDLAAGDTVFGGSLATNSLTTGDIVSGGNIVCNNLTAQGNINASSIFTSGSVIRAGATYSIQSDMGIMTVTGSANINAGIASDVLNTSILTTSTLSATGRLDISNLTITPVNNTLIFSGGIATPSVSTVNIRSTDVSTTALYVTQSIVAPNLAVLDLASTEIINPQGSLSTASITAENLTTSTLSTNYVISQILNVSSIAMSGNLDMPGNISMDVGNIGNLTTQTLYGDNITAINFAVETLAVNSINITGAFSGPDIVILDIPNALITASSILTSQISTSILNTDSLYISGFISTGSTLILDASNVVTNTISTMNLNTSSLYTSTLTTNKIVMGQPINPSTFGPYFVCTSSTNCVVAGRGDYFNPMILSNVRPSGYTSNTPYQVTATFQYIVPNSGNFVPGGQVDVQASLFWGQELATTSYISNAGVSTISLYGYYAQDLTSNVRASAVNNTSSNAWTWSSKMVNDSKATVIMQSYSNVNFSLANYDTYINMQNGVLKWNYALNDTTIQNSLNDISTRNLLYYGSLNFVSDPRLKQNVEAADLERCHEIIRDIPLHRYAFKDAYVNTFGVTDIHRLGVMADEYEQFFPKSITLQDVAGFSTVKTVDTQQLDMAHLGATQYLLKEVEALRSTVKSLSH